MYTRIHTSITIIYEGKVYIEIQEHYHYKFKA